MRTHRFNLIELLIVVAIIGILASMLLPALQRARIQTLKAVCTSQQKSGMVAQVLNVNDHNDEIAARGTWDSATLWKSHYKWVFNMQDNARGYGKTQLDGWSGTGMLYKREYLVDARALWCPANSSPNLAFDHSGWGFREDPWSSGNNWMSSGNTQRTEIYTLETGGNPSSTALLADLFAYHSFYQPGGPLADEYQHKDGYVVVYMDGSGRFYKDESRSISSQKLWAQGSTEKNIWLQFDER